MSIKPNVIFVFSDQHRAEATGYFGNKDVKTPNLDILKQESISFSTAVSGMSVCCPARASLITGQYPLTHGVFVNDVCLNNCAVSMAQAFQQGGYDTAYIGKWHLDGHGRSQYIPKERRQGFDYWRVLECTHNYNDSYYYGSDPTKLKWEGYDAEAQTREAQRYIQNRGKDKPFLLVLSWGPPHNPYHTAPEKYRALYDSSALSLRPNVPKEMEEESRRDLAGYYAHVSALDALTSDLLDTVRQEGIAENTIFIYTSDHGDMLGSQGQTMKQKPWDESILVPFLLHYPKLFGRNEREERMPINTPDILPTLLGLCDLSIPETVEGINYAPYLKGEKDLKVEAAILQCIHPFGQWHRDVGGKEYRGIRNERYTYVKDLEGPWLLYDNAKDPFQLYNLCNREEHKELQKYLDDILMSMLKERNDEFLPGSEYIKKWKYTTDGKGSVPYIS